MFMMASFIGLMMFGGLALLPTYEEPISEDPEIDDNDDVEDLAIPQSSADVMLGSFLNDMMDGSDGYDRFHGADGDDTLFGHGGDDELIGGAGNDILTGRDGSGDFLNGGSGDDTIQSDTSDVITTGDGADTVIHVTTPPTLEAVAKIMDFDPSQDQIIFEVDDPETVTLSIDQTDVDQYSITLDGVTQLTVYSETPFDASVISLQAR